MTHGGDGVESRLQLAYGLRPISRETQKPGENEMRTPKVAIGTVQKKGKELPLTLGTPAKGIPLYENASHAINDEVAALVPKLICEVQAGEDTRVAPFRKDPPDGDWTPQNLSAALVTHLGAPTREAKTTGAVEAVLARFDASLEKLMGGTKPSDWFVEAMTETRARLNDECQRRVGVLNARNLVERMRLADS